MQPDTKQNNRKPINDSCNCWSVKLLTEKINAAKTKRFLVHCFGLKHFKNSTITFVLALDSDLVCFGVEKIKHLPFPFIL